MSLLSIAGATPSDEGFELKSGKFYDNTYLSRTPSQVGNRRTWTFSCWIKSCVVGAETQIFSAYNGSGGYSDYIRFNNLTDGLVKWTVAAGGNSGIEGALVPTQIFRDPSAWYHMVFTLDTTLAIAGNRMRMYVNGEEVTSFSTDTNPSQDYQCVNVNTTVVHRIGSSAYNAGSPFHGYLAETYFIDGQAVGPEYFGETNASTNQWQPKNGDDVKETLEFGRNGFYQKYNSTEVNNSFPDSATGFAVGAVGDAHTDTTIKKIGTASLQLDGTTDYLEILPSPGSNFPVAVSYTHLTLPTKRIV